ncbi:MAG: alpha/beta hydrolase, partial [Silicimonas sp.]|nr:alpha/beta hydrolase [Silicimonas sp.]
GSPTASVLFLHGGGFVVGGLDSHDDVCAEICATTGFRVVAVDYRLAPEHKFPAAFVDAWTVARWLIETHPDAPVTLVGDSAGGNLAAAVAHHARGRLEGVIGQVLIYPGLGGPRDSASYVTHAEAPMLTAKDIDFYRSILFDGGEPVGDPTYAPLQDSDFTGLPPTVIITAECDPLSDDGGL